MLVILSLAFAAGLACGLARLKVLALILATIIFSLLTAIGGASFGLGLGRTAIVLFCVVTLLQVSNLIGAILSDAPKPQQVSVHMPPKRELCRTVQTAIAQALRAHLEPVPLDDIPPQLRIKLALLETR
jgi:hypothetical protein